MASTITVNASYQCSPNDEFVNVIPLVGMQITLPPAGSVFVGKRYVIKDIGSAAGTNNIVVAAADGALIDGSATFTLNVNSGAVSMAWLGASWGITNYANAIRPLASATDNTLPRFDGTSGKVIQTSGVTVDDNDGLYLHKWVVNSSSTTTYTLASTDGAKQIEFSATSATVTCTLPATFAQGYRTRVTRAGAIVTFAAASGGTLRSLASAVNSGGTWSVCDLYVSANTSGTQAVWVLSGSIA